MDSPIIGTGTTTLTPGDEVAGVGAAATGAAGVATGAEVDEDAVDVAVAALFDVSITYRSLPTAI